MFLLIPSMTINSILVFARLFQNAIFQSLNIVLVFIFLFGA